MKKLKLAIIGQGRSGRDIHGTFYKSEKNKFYDIKYVVEQDDYRRAKAEREYPGCIGLSSYTELFDKDVDIVVNASYSQQHYSITKDLLEHGKNVLVEKPFARTRYECENLITIAKENNAILAVFQQSNLAPFYEFTKELMTSGKIGEIKHISVRYNGFSRRWDWQTLQCKCAGNVFNTGPHPIGVALGLIDWDRNAKVVYSKLDNALASGDAEDSAKIIIDAPNKPSIDIEISSMDAFSNYHVKLQGTRGTYQTNIISYKMKYIVDGENPEQKVIFESLKGEDSAPMYCSENLITHDEEGNFDGTAFDVGTEKLYENLYYKITEGQELKIKPEDCAKVISVIEACHVQNPMPIKWKE